MTTDRWMRTKEIFREVVKRSPGERAAYLDEACEGDALLRREIEELLSSHEESTGFLELSDGAGPLSAAPGADLTGSRIGGFLLEAVISSGGMGTVYRAVQEQPHRTVAVKVMREGIASRSALRRFEYEAEILGRLNHPRIARVIEAGTHRAEGGAPYFVMEYIQDARPITAYAWERKLSLTKRLELFLQVCEAVHHGHQKGIIHRDLKPGNLLVDGEGQVKVIDFGVARATDSDLALTTAQTDVGQLLGTVQYMSPEQCKADPDDLDFRSDVYALGVVLYELLCGALPYDVRKAAVFEATRIIREVEPRRPSGINRSLRGDVETIVLKALEKDRSARYQTVGELESDLGRYLAGEEISVRPAGPVARMVKRIRRNPVVSAAGGVVLVMAAAFAAYVLFVSYPQLKRERDIAEAERRKAMEAERQALSALEDAKAQRRVAEEAQAVSMEEAENTKTINRFLEEMLSAADPFREGGEVKVLEMLDRAAERIDREFPDKPEIEAPLRYTLGVTYFKNGRNAEAENHFIKTIALLGRIGKGESPEIVEAKLMLGHVLTEEGRLAEAEPLIMETRESCQRMLGDESPLMLDILNCLALLRKDQGRLQEAEQLLRMAKEKSCRILGEENDNTLEMMNNLAWVLLQQGKLDEAVSMFREVLALREEKLGEDHLNTLTVKNALASALTDQGKLAEAEIMQREVLSAYRSRLGPEHPNTHTVMNNLGNTLIGQRKYGEAESVFSDLLEIRSSTLHEGHPDLLNVMSNLAHLRYRLGNIREAESLCRKVLAGRRGYLNEDHPEVLKAMGNLGNVLFSKGDLSEAESIYRKVLEARARVLGDQHPETLAAMNNLAHILTEMDRFEEAEGLLRKALEIFRGTLGEENPQMHLALYNLAGLLLDKEDFQEAESITRSLLDTQRRVHGGEHQNTLGALNLLAEILGRQEKFTEANALFEKGLEIAQRNLPGGPLRTARLHLTYGRCLYHANDFESAEKHLLEAHEQYLSVYGASHRTVIQTICFLTELYDAWDRPDQAAEWRKKIPEYF